MAAGRAAAMATDELPKWRWWRGLIASAFVACCYVVISHIMRQPQKPWATTPREWHPAELLVAVPLIGFALLFFSRPR